MSKKFDYSIPIRGLDEKLYQQARADALSKGYKNIGLWMNEAVAMKLALHSVKFYIDGEGYPTLEDNQGNKARLTKTGWKIIPAKKKAGPKAGGRGGAKN